MVSNEVNLLGVEGGLQGQHTERDRQERRLGFFVGCVEPVSLLVRSTHVGRVRVMVGSFGWVWVFDSCFLVNCGRTAAQQAAGSKL